MRRKEQTQQTSGRGRSLISTRTSQQQQRKMQSPSASSRSFLPRSYSSPSSQDNQDCQTSSAAQREYVTRSYSSPDSKASDYRRNSDSFFRPKTHGSRNELDSDLENFEQFEECFLEIDADQDERSLGRYQSSPEREEPKRVVTALLQGSGLQRVCIRPVASSQSREAAKKAQKDDSKGTNRLNFRPLVVKMPARHVLHQRAELPSHGVEELQTSPQLEMESEELDREMDNAEQQLDKGVAIATEESDADTTSKIDHGIFQREWIE